MSIALTALRNCKRRPLRFAMLVVSVGATTAIMLIWSSLSKGFTESLLHATTSLEAGEFQLHHPRYLHSQDQFDLIENVPQSLASLDARGFRSTPRIYTSALVSVGESASGARLTGVTPDLEKTVTTLHNHIAEGSWLATDDPKGVVIGKLLAKQLSANPGTELVLLGQAVDGSIASDVLQVRGILRSVNNDIDNRGVYLLEETFREIFLLQIGAHELIIADHPDLNMDESRSVLAALPLGGTLSSWQDIKPLLARTLELLSITVYFTLMFTYIALGGLLLNTAFMTTNYRKREYGIMQSLGAPPQYIVALIVMEFWWLASFAALFALTVGLPIAGYLEHTGIDFGFLIDRMSLAGVTIEPVLRAQVGMRQVVVPLAFLLITTPLFALYPAWEVARLPPLKALNTR